MATKQLNGRIQWKRDTSANWESNNPVLLDGEIIIVTTNAGETRFKVGDGVKTYTQLPFQDEAVRALITELSGTVDTKLTTPSGTTGQLLGYTTDNVVGAVNPPRIPFDAVYSNILFANSWTASSSGYSYEQSFIVTGIQDDLFFVYPEYSALFSRKIKQIYDWSLIEEIVLSSGTVIFYTNEVTTNDINFSIVYNATEGVLQASYPNFTGEVF